MFEKFHFPQNGQAEAFWKAQIILGKNNPRFNDYFSNLIYRVNFTDAESKTESARFDNNHVEKILSTINYLSKLVTRNIETVKCDVLINPSRSTSNRLPEQNFLSNLITNLANENLQLCIIDPNLKLPLVRQAINQNQQKVNIKLLNPEKSLGFRTQKLLLSLSHLISNLEYQYLSKLLNQYCIELSKEFLPSLQQKIYTRLLWSLISEKVEFELAIVRVEWDLYSFPIKETSQKRGKKTIGFQHGVISHTLDIPVTVDKFFTFGKQSARLLLELNNQFKIATQQTGLCQNFQPCGAIIDNILSQQNNYSKKTVLIVDQSVSRAIKFNGLKEQIDELNRLIEELLAFEEISKVIIRPHPEAKSLKFWSVCKEHYPDKFELSNAQFKLEIDLSRSSVAIGFFSGVLAVAAASGIPSYFLSTLNGYHTPDLDCFQEFNFLRQEMLYDIRSLMINEEFYLTRRQKAMECSSLYYANNQRIDFNSHFIKEQILT